MRSTRGEYNDDPQPEPRLDNNASKIGDVDHSVFSEDLHVHPCPKQGHDGIHNASSSCQFVTRCFVRARRRRCRHRLGMLEKQRTKRNRHLCSTDDDCETSLLLLRPTETEPQNDSRQQPPGQQQPEWLLFTRAKHLLLYKRALFESTTQREQESSSTGCALIAPTKMIPTIPLSSSMTTSSSEPVVEELEEARAAPTPIIRNTRMSNQPQQRWWYENDHHEKNTRSDSRSSKKDNDRQQEQPNKVQSSPISSCSQEHKETMSSSQKATTFVVLIQDRSSDRQRKEFEITKVLSSFTGSSSVVASQETLYQTTAFDEESLVLKHNSEISTAVDLVASDSDTTIELQEDNTDTDMGWVNYHQSVVTTMSPMSPVPQHQVVEQWDDENERNLFSRFGSFRLFQRPRQFINRGKCLLFQPFLSQSFESSEVHETKATTTRKEIVEE